MKIFIILAIVTLIVIFIFIHLLFEYLDNKKPKSADPFIQQDEQMEYDVIINYVPNEFNIKCIVDGHNWYFVNEDFAVCKKCGLEVKKKYIL
jgi:hypothetical protein